MVAVVSGSSLGLFNSSRNILGGDGAPGNPGTGRSGEQGFVNSTTGNLVLQSRDEFLAGIGSLSPIIRTYNSQGLLNDDNGDNWRLGVHQRLSPVSGTANSAGSSIAKTFGDGAEIVYTYSTSLSRYVSTVGNGAHDTLSYNSSTGEWTWTDGSGRNTETYDSTGRLVSTADQDSNTLSYTYVGNKLIRIDDASVPAQQIHFDYENNNLGNNLVAIRVVSDGVTQTLTRYDYDTSDRLTEVRVDLSPSDNSEADGDIYVTTYTYDGASRRIASISQGDGVGVGSTVSFTYQLIDGAYRVTSVTDAENRVTTYTYSSPTGGGGSSTPTTVPANTGALTPGEPQTTTTDYYLDTGELTYPPGTASPPRLYSDIPIRGFSGSRNSRQVFRIEVPAGSSALYVGLNGPSPGNADIYLSREVIPRYWDAQHSSTYNENNELIEVLAPDAGTWYLTVEGWDPFSDATLFASVKTGTNQVQTLTPGIAASGMIFSGDEETSREFTFNVPAGTNDFRLTLGGTVGGNVNMFVRHESSEPGEYPWSSTGSTSNESVFVTSPASGTWTVVLRGAANDPDANLVLHFNTGSNTPPSVDAGTSQSVASAGAVTLTGTASDAQGAVTYQWTQVSGPTVTLNNSATASASFTAPTVSTATTLRFRLTATDSNGVTNTDEVTVLVGAPAEAQATMWSTPSLLESSSTAATGLVVGAGRNHLATAVWQEGNTLYARTYNPFTHTWSAAVAISGSSTTPVDFSLSVDQATGHALVVWRDSANGEIRANRLIVDAQNGTAAWQGSELIATVTGATVSDLRAGINESRRAAVVWTETSGANKTIMIRRREGSSTSWPAAETVATTTESVDSVGLYITSDGHLQVAWRQGSGASYVVMGRSLWSAWEPVAQISTGAGPISQLSVKGLPRRNVVSWIEGGVGTVVFGFGSEWDPLVEPETSGTITSFDGLFDLDFIFTAYTTSDGEVILASSEGNETLAIGTAPTDVRIYRNNHGRAVVTWRDGGDIFAATFESGSWTGAQKVVSAGTGVSNAYAFVSPALGENLDNEGFAVWIQNDGTTSSVYTSNYLLGEPYGANPYYTVQTGDTWESIAEALYGSSAAASVLQTSLNSPTLTAGLQLSGIHGVLTVETTVTPPPYYLVPAGATWASITQAIYGTSDANAVAALQAAMGSPALEEGLQLAVPLQLTYTPVGGGGGSTIYQQVDITSPLGLVTTMVNDSSGRLTRLLSPTTGGVRLERAFAYDTDGNVTRITDDPSGLNLATTFEYDSNGNLTLSRDAKGNTVTRTYSATNKLLNEVRWVVPDPDGAGSGSASVPLVTRYVYDAEDHLRFVITDEQRITEYVHNGAGRLTSELRYVGDTYDYVFPDINATRNEAELAAWAAAQDRTRIERTDYEYDPRGLMSVKRQYGATDSTGAGVPSTQLVTHNVYDQRGYLIETITPRGETSTPSDPTDYRTAFTYDGLGRVTTRTQWLADGSVRVINTEYDDVDNTVVTTFAGGLVRTETYNDAGELISVTNTGPGSANLGTTSYAYDGNGRLRMVTDSLGQRTFTFYDEAGRRNGTVDADGTLTEFIYDDAGRLVKSIAYADRLTATTLGTLVSGGVPTNVTVASLVSDLASVPGRDPARDQIVRLVYDAAGRVVYSIDAAGAVTQTVYDGAGRVTDEIRYANPVTIARTVDELSPGSVGVTISVNDRRTRYAYTDDGLLKSMLDARGFFTDYFYDNAGRLTSQIQYANEAPLPNRDTAPLDSLRPQVDNEVAIDPEKDITTHYFYDGYGRRVGVVDGEGFLTETVYDLDGNVAQTARYNQSFTVGNTTTLQSMKAAVLPTTIVHITSFEYDGEGKLTEQTDHEGTLAVFSYDIDGNLIAATRASGTGEARTTQARYDVMGRLVAELTAEGSALLTTGMTQTQIDAIWAQYSVTHQYDLASRRVSTTDQNGNRTLFFYDVDGRLAYTVNALGEVVENRYNALGQLRETVSYINRISVTGLMGGVLTTTLTDRVTAAADSSRDAWTRLTYTPTGRVATTTTAQGGQATYVYNAFGEQTQKIERIDSTHSLTHLYTYDARGQLTKTQWDPAGFNTSQDNTYDAFGRLTTTTDALGNITRFTYDSLGRVITTVDPLNATRHTSYDAFGRVLSMADALNNTTTYAYDDVVRGVVVTTPEGISLSTVRNRHGQSATVTDGRGNTTTYHYDANGRLTEASDSLGTLNEQTYDRAGRLLTITDGNDSVTTIVYDAANRVFTRTVDSGAGGVALTTTYAYDGQGRVVDTTDPRGVVTRTEYDLDGRVTAVIADFGSAPHLNIRTEYQYDDADRLLFVREGAGSLAGNPVGSPGSRITQYVYDTLGRRTAEIVDPGAGRLNLTTSYEYDSNGNVVRKVDPEQHTTRYVYDAGNRLKYTIDALGGVTGNTYDAEGRIVAVRRYAVAINLGDLPPTGRVTVAQLEALCPPLPTDRVEQTVFDRDGRAAFKIDAMGGVTQYEYDASGNVVRTHIYSERIPEATYSTPASVTAALAGVNDGMLSNDRDIRTVYDARNRATFMIDGAGAVVRHTFDDVGNLIARTEFAILRTGSGVPNLATMETWAATATNLDPENDRTTHMWYDGAGRLAYTLDAEGYLTKRSYDGVGNLTDEVAYAVKPVITGSTALADIPAGITTTPLRDQTTTRTYDGAGRILSVEDAEGFTESYTYDAVGNRLTMTNKKGDLWQYVYDANRRLLEEHSPVVAVTRMTRSGGNLAPDTYTASLVTRLTYDSLGNVRTRTEAYGREEARTTTYTYDLLGRQVRVDFPDVLVYAPGLDDLNRAGNAVVPAEVVTASFSTVTYDTFGNAIRNQDAAGNYSHKAYDKLGRVVYEVDAERYVTKYAYDTFGNRTELTRYANRLNDSGITESTLLDAGMIAGRVGVSATYDRTVLTVYDRLNRVSRVTQPTVFYFEPLHGTPANQAGLGAASTRFDYDAFGNVVKESTLVNPLDELWAEKYSYYDRKGNLAAQVDALGYVTAFTYDAVGNVTRKIEYATALAQGTWSLEGHATPAEVVPQVNTAAPASGYDRDTRYVYDRMNRKVEERLVNFAHSAASDLNAIAIADRVTTFGYDAVGDQTRTTDAAGGNTYVYFDSLGRMIAIAQPTRNLGNGSNLTPLTELMRDAFGNLTVQIEHASGASAADGVDYTAGAASEDDRTSYLYVDAYGRVLQSRDATGAVRFASYNRRGDVAKEWQVVHGNDNTASTLVTVYEYDRLGRQTAVVEPQKIVGGVATVVRSQSLFNSFGEVIARGVNGAYQEYFDYDQAGHLWRTNSGDGVDKVYFYNLAGQATSEIRSTSYPLRNIVSAAALNASSLPLIRTNTRYDLNGRVVDRQMPSFESSTRQFVPDGIEPLYAGFGVADIPVPNNSQAVYRQVVSESGETIYIVDPYATLDQDGGYYFNGTAYVQDPHYEVLTAKYLYWRASINQTETRVFEYRLSSDPNGDWHTAPIVSLPGGRFGVDLSRFAAGEYQYRVSYTREGETDPYTRATGILDLVGSSVVEPTVRSDMLDDSGVVAPIGIGNITSPPPAAAGLPLYAGVSARIVSTTMLNDTGGGTFYAGENSVELRFQPYTGGALIEIEYVTKDETAWYSSHSRTIALWVDDVRGAGAGLFLNWEDPLGSSGSGGIVNVTAVRVYDSDGVLRAQTLGPQSPAREPAPNETEIIWRAPRDLSVIATFEVRLKGTTAWQAVDVDRFGGFFVVDGKPLSNGTWEYRVSYTRNNTLTASAEGELDVMGGSYRLQFGEEAEPPPPAPEAVPPIQVSSLGPTIARIESFSSIGPTVSGAVEYEDGYGAEPVVTWWGDNRIELTLGYLVPTLSTRVEVDYITADRPVYTPSGSPSRWRFSGTQPGVARTIEFGQNPAFTTAVLTVPNFGTPDGGISSVTQVRIYQQIDGEWVLLRSTDPSMLIPGRNMYWRAPTNPRVEVNVQMREVGTEAWTNKQAFEFAGSNGTYLGVDLAGLEGEYEYRIVYSGIAEDSGGTRILSQAEGLLTVPAPVTGQPLEVTQTGLLFSNSAGNVGNLRASGTTLMWDRTPQAGTSVIVRYRAAGSQTWLQATPAGTAPNYSFDVGPGAVEYEIIYYRATPDAPYAQATGVLNAEPPPPVVPPQESVAPIRGANVGPVDFEIVESAQQFGGADGEWPSEEDPNYWWGNENIVDLSWEDVESAEVRVELDYITKTRRSFDYYRGTVDEDVINDGGWQPQQSLIPGVARKQYFEFGAGEASTGTTLYWEEPEPDDPDVEPWDLNGGIESITRVRVYVRDAQGEWVLRFDRDGAAPVSGRSLYWKPPLNNDLTQVFRYKSLNSDEWTRILVGNQAGYSYVSLSALPAGAYEYMLSYEASGIPVSEARGTFSVSEVQYGSQIAVTQNVITIDQGAKDLGRIKADGLMISWMHEPEPDATVTVRSRVAGTEVWHEQLVTETDGVFFATVTGSLSTEVEYQIFYTRDGETEPYIVASGSLNRSVPVMVTPATLRVRDQINTFVTEPLPIEVEHSGSLIRWEFEAEPDTTMIFRYRSVEDPNWSTLGISGSDPAYSVYPGVLPLGTYFYELTYVRNGETEPYALAGGTMVLQRVFHGQVTHTNTTTQGGSYVIVSPTPSQQLDRWGNAIAVENESGHTTSYTYNQLNQVTSVQQAIAQIVDTTGGTVSTSIGASGSRNYYDIAGRLIGIRDGNGNPSTATYNVAGQLLTEDHADGGEKSYVYDPFGNLALQTDELGFRTRNTYDKANRLVQVTREIVAGGLMSGVAEHVQVESFTYDEASRRIAETNGEGETLRYDFDLNDQIVRRVTPSGYETFFEYDELGKKTREVSANGDEQSWEYDNFGRLVSSTDMAFAVTHYEYNEAGLITRKYNDHGQDITYEYDDIGRLISVLDDGAPPSAFSTLRASSKLTEYEYDEQNRRTRERTTIDGELHADTWIEYDSLGRLWRVSSSLSTVEYSYDAAGNRTRIRATYFDHARQPRVQDLWYTYDSMNRVLISQGVNNAGQIGINTAQGIELTYNVGGQRITARTFRPVLGHVTDYDWQNQTIIDQWSITQGITTETYGYDGLGRLTTTDSEVYITEFGNSYTDIIRTNERQYDRASREISDTSVTAENNWLTTRVRVTSYDDDGRVFSQTTRKNGLVEAVVRFGEARYIEHYYSNTVDGIIESYYDWTLGYDQAGVLRGYSIDVYDNGSYRYTTTYRQNYLLTDTYLQTTEDATSSSYLGYSVPQSGSTRRVYNVNGEMVEFHDTRKPENSRFFAYDTDGQVVTAVQGTFPTPEQGRQALRNALHQADNQVKAQHYFFANGEQIGSFGQLTDEHNIFKANFDVNFTAVSPGYPTSVPEQVVVQEGETLRSIAMRVFGDANLWYVIAEENGLTEPDAQLTAGTVLQIPNEVVSLTNTADSFKPFDINEVIGETTPTQPAPPPPRKKKGCGVLGMIIVVVVAVVVTWLTKGATAPYFAKVLGAFWGGVAAAATGAVVGSAVSQGVAIAIGQRDSFSWKEVAAAGLTAGLTQGAAPALNAVGSEFVQAGINNAIGQGVNIALGLQEEFNWGAVAAAAASAPLARAAGNVIAGGMPNTINPFFTEFAIRLASNGIHQIASVVFNGGKVDYKGAFADAFGQTLGNSLVPTPGASTSGSGLGGTPADAYGASDDELSEVQVGVQRIPLDSEGRRLSNNPTESITAGSAISPDEQTELAEIVVQGQRINPGDDYGLDLFAYLHARRSTLNEQQRSALTSLERLATNRYEARRYGIVTASTNRRVADAFEAAGGAGEIGALDLLERETLRDRGRGNGPNLVSGALMSGMQWVDNAAQRVHDFGAWLRGFDNSAGNLAAAHVAFYSGITDVAANFGQGILGLGVLATDTDTRIMAARRFGLLMDDPGRAAGDSWAAYINSDFRDRGLWAAETLAGLGGIGTLGRVGRLPSEFEALASEMRLNSPDLGMGVEKASPELIEAIAGRRTVVYAQPGSQELRYLDWIGAEANVGGPDYTHILLRQQPSKAAILEEFLHGTQSRLGVIDRLGPRGFGSAETHVKDFMIRHQRMLGLTDEDVAILKRLRDAGY